MSNYKLKFCQVPGCKKEVFTYRYSSKYCFEHRSGTKEYEKKMGYNKIGYNHSGKSKIKWNALHGQKFFDVFDKEFNIPTTII